ncbi:hypothetical protein B0H14DRAFT_3891746 [Mycena olivaceomarginata]|nr:hypothetical protein B0H14DRAFT_3891746 [Mycena olivaceomarginata]
METELWNELDEDPHAAGFDLGIDKTAQQYNDLCNEMNSLWNAGTIGQNSSFSLGEGNAEADNLFEDDNNDEFLAEIMQNATINDPKEGNILDFDHHESAEPSVEWAPYPSKMLFLLDTLDNLPRLRISNSLMKVFLWILNESGAKDVPVPTTQYKTVKGNIFYMNDPRTIIAKECLLTIPSTDWANPQTRKFIRVYPEIPEDGVIREMWHAQKWHKDMDLNNLSPMYDAKHLNAHFYVNKVARLDSGQLVIPVRWLTCGKKICADAYAISISSEGAATVLDSETILIDASELTASYLDLKDKHCLPSWSEKTVKSGFPERMPNPKRVLAGGDPLYSSFIDYFGDDVSGNRSKSWNKHWNAYMTHRNLPRTLPLEARTVGDNTKSSPRSKPKAKATTRTRRANVKFAAKDKEKGKRKAGSPSGGSDSGTAHKKPRTKSAQDSAPPRSTSAGSASGQGASGATGATDASGASAATGSAQASGTTNPTGMDEDQEEEMIEEILTKEPANRRLRVPWGIQPKEVPKGAKPTQRAFQRFIRALCGLLKQSDVLPSAKDQLTHYDKRFDEVDDIRVHVRSLVDASRTAIREAIVRATTIRSDAERLSGPIANDIARISAQHLSSAFTMVLKAGLKGFCPDVDGPAQYTYNQLHRRLAASAFQFLSSTFGLAALNVNNFYGNDYELLCDMYDNFVFGTLAQNTKMERRRPGSLSESQKNSTAYKARARLSRSRFDTAHRLKMRKPVQRMAYVQEDPFRRRARQWCALGPRQARRNPTVTRFFLEKLDVEAEEYRKRNAKGGQKKPAVRQRNPLKPASDIGSVLPPDVPIDFFTPEFYNSLTVKERARYTDTGVAFPLPQYAFNKSHAHWLTMGKAEFMKAYSNEVLAQYHVPSAEEIAELHSDADDEEEEEEIDLVDMDDEMDVDQEN